MIYLDHAATTPVRPEVAAVMAECLTSDGVFANPSSIHGPGIAAAARVRVAREQVAGAVGASPPEIVWTSGATESNNLGLLGAARYYAQRGRHLVTAKTEHKSVIDAARQLESEGWQVTWLKPEDGVRVAPEQLEAAVRDDTVLVSLMQVNNETGVVQDIARMAAITRARGIVFHVDAAQALGKCPIDLSQIPLDLMSFSAHKLGGPKGVGALFVRMRPRARVKPLMFGGGHERGMRSGTIATHQVAGMGLACTLAVAEQAVEQTRLAGLRDHLWARLSQALPEIHRNGGDAAVVGNILNVSFAGVDGESLRTDLPELAVSSGSACSSGGSEPSYVLRALGRNDMLADASLRFSLGRESTEADIGAAAEQVIAAVRRLRALSPRWGRAA